MPTFKKILPFRLSNFIMLVSLTLVTIGAFWLFFIGLTQAGICFPEIKTEQFADLGFFSVSIFGVIIFLTMIPFQTVEGRLSPGFFSRISNRTTAHFGLYVLVTAAIMSFLIISLQKMYFVEHYLSQLFAALIASIIFAIIFHRSWVIRCLYQPYVIYQHIHELKGEETEEETWLELFECVYKAIKQGRINDARNIINLMSHHFKDCCREGKTKALHEDLANLYAIAQDCRPVARIMEKKWPFLLSKET
ncbi:hypothetical protein [Parachlamydia sp. AcF125]|uniref:hypothetical protein n=1 Tax=Parachlamydia sp. AcF125 TaxID=2795736 RepID=UPI001BC9A25B|nr:hypothetical protein [Parachlamydia sp. AcF125]MBS4168914.1 hypothetical protein [Parachlamydia sp. AcF125]